MAPVTDEVGLLSSGDAERINSWLREIKAQSGVEIAVYVAKSLQGREVADFSLAVAEKWGLGRKKTDKGLLFLIAPKERKMRFEVGYGLEGDITDAFSRRVLDEEVRPRFRDGRYAEGITAAVARVAEKAGVQGELVEAAHEPLLQTRIEGLPLWVWLVLAVVVLGFQALLFVLRLLGVVSPARVMRRGGWHHHGGGWGGGGFGGFGGSGGWGGGGGGFGGGGASSDW